MERNINESGDGVVVIVVDDDPAVRNSLKFSLEIEGFAVRTYRDGGDLLGDSALPSDGCLVIDYLMPDMSGLDLLDRLRVRHVEMPAILITSHPSSVLRERAADAGVPIIEKPFLGNALVDGIRGALGQAGRFARPESVLALKEVPG